MPVIVCGVVPQRTQGESVLVDIPRVTNQRRDEIAGAHVMQQVAEELAAEGVVAEILNHAADVGEAASLLNLLGARVRKAGQQHGRNCAVPQRIDVRFMGQHGIGCRLPRRGDADDKYRRNNGGLDDIAHTAFRIRPSRSEWPVSAGH
jgi:hypothetical protein